MEEYNAQVIGKEEERIIKNARKKTIAIIMRCIFGIFGVDKFVMGCKKRGLETLFYTLGITILPIISMIFILIPIVGYGLFSIITFFCNIANFIRFLYYLITGLRMISKDAKEIANKYERMMK